MSRLTGNDAKGLMEAYSAVYASPQHQQELVEQIEKNNIQEDFEIDPDALVEVMIEYLVLEGYAKTEKKAIMMLPHLSEEFVYGAVTHMIVSESFYSDVDTLISEGYDLSDYTWEELYEGYIDHRTDLHEFVPALAAGVAPFILPAAAAGLYALNKNKADKLATQGVMAATDAGKGFLNRVRGVFGRRTGASPANQENTPKPGEKFGKLRDKIDPRRIAARRAEKERQAQIENARRGRQVDRFFQGLQNYNQRPASPGPDLKTNLGRAVTLGTTAKNLLLGKTGSGFATRAAAGLGGDQLAFSGANTEKAWQAIQSTLQKTRAAGEAEKEKTRKEGEAERARFASQQGGSVPSWLGK